MRACTGSSINVELLNGRRQVDLPVRSNLAVHQSHHKQICNGRERMLQQHYQQLQLMSFFCMKFFL